MSYEPQGYEPDHEPEPTFYQLSADLLGLERETTYLVQDVWDKDRFPIISEATTADDHAEAAELMRQNNVRSAALWNRR